MVMQRNPRMANLSDPRMRAALHYSKKRRLARIAASTISVTDPSFASVTALFGYEGATVLNEGSGSNGTLRGAANLSVTQKKFGSKSLDVIGNSDHELTGGEGKPGTSNFTFEGFAYYEGAYDNLLFRSITGNFTAGNVGTWCFFVTDNPDNFLQFNSPGFVLSSSNPAPRDAWFHFAASRIGNTLYLFLDGALEGSLGVAGMDLGAAELDILVGWNKAGTGDRWNGYVDELRFTEGVGRYSSAFTVPTSAYPRS